MAKTKKQVEVIQESDTGRNERFRDKSTGKEMTRTQFVSEIEKGHYPDYYVRKMGDKKTPVSKPDGNPNNNLG